MDELVATKCHLTSRPEDDVIAELARREFEPVRAHHVSTGHEHVFSDGEPVTRGRGARHEHDADDELAAGACALMIQSLTSPKPMTTSTA